MGWERWKERGQQLLQAPFLREPLYIISLSLLSLILPLAFLLLARLANAYYILSVTSPPPPSSLLFPLSFLLSTNTNLLHLLVSIISVTALLRALMGRFAFTLYSKSNSNSSKAHLYTAWVFLCMFHICVVLGIEGTLEAGFWTVDLGVIGKGGSSRNLASRVLFFIGLHETMLHWSRAIVRPVVDDTVFGVVREERWLERVAMGASFGGLCWWGLRTEVEALVDILELKRELWMQVEISDLVNCWLYYLMVTISLVRLVRGLVCLVSLMFCSGLSTSSGHSGGCSGGDDDDGKV